MKASVLTKFGGPEVLQLQDVERPRPRDDQMLIRAGLRALLGAPEEGQDE